MGDTEPMKPKLTFLLALTFLFLFSCSEEKPKPKIESIENPKVRESFEKYLLPIIKSFDMKKLEEWGFGPESDFVTNKLDKGFKVDILPVDKQSEIAFQQGYMSGYLILMGSFQDLNHRLPDLVSLEFVKLSHDEPWKLITFDGHIENYKSKSIDEYIRISPPEVQAYIKSKFETMDQWEWIDHPATEKVFPMKSTKKKKNFDYISSVDFNNLPLDEFPFPCDIAQGIFNGESWNRCIDSIKDGKETLMDIIIYPINYSVNEEKLWDENDISKEDILFDKNSCQFTNGKAPDGIAYNKDERKIYCGDSSEERFRPHRYSNSISPPSSSKSFLFKDHNKDGYMDVALKYRGRSCDGSGCGGEGEIILTKKSMNGKLERVLPICELKSGKEVFHDKSGLLCGSKTN
jgi:hypothetical protein